MSSVYWHSPSGEARLAGAERHYAGYFMERLVESFIPDDPSGWPEKLFKLDDNRQRLGSYKEAVRIWCLGSFLGNPEPLVYGDLKESPFDLVLNTAVTIGNDAVKLFARMHGQCEIHAWVDGPNRAWLADIIRRGRKLNVLRSEMGWEDVISLLVMRDDEPVVTSFSICEQFPDPWWILSNEGDEDDEVDDDEAGAMSHEEAWRRGMEILRGAEEGFLEIEPKRWADYGFGNGKSLFDFIDAIVADERRKPVDTSGPGGWLLKAGIRG